MSEEIVEEVTASEDVASVDESTVTSTAEETVETPVEAEEAPSADR